MIQNFERYARVLRKLGNTRHGYVIFEFDNKVHDVSTIQKLSHRIEQPKDVNDFDVIFDAKEQVIVFIDTEQLLKTNPEIGLYATEIVTDKQIVSIPGFKLNTETDTEKFWLADTLDYNNYIVLEPNKNTVVNGVKAESYHSIIVDDSLNIAILYIWDTREIVAVEENLSYERKQNLLSLKNCNDSARKLYCWKAVYDACSENIQKQLAKKFLNDVIETY